MAKPKIKFDLKKVQDFFLAHGEKLALGLFGLIFLMLIYGIFGLERMDTTPRDLEDKISQARQQLDRAQLDIKEAGIVVKDYSQRAKQVTTDVQLAAFSWHPVNPPVWPPGSKRTMPELLALESIRVSTGQGAFDLRPEGTTAPAASGETAPPRQEGSIGRLSLNTNTQPSTARTPAAGSTAAPTRNLSRNAEGLRYAVITGLVPVQRQAEEFKETFSGVAAPRPSTDSQPVYRKMPSGLAAWVQRAEVKPGVAADQLTWETLDQSTKPELDNNKIKSRFNGARDELADRSVVDRLLAEPLPPLADGAWDARVVVHEQLPLAPKADTAATSTARAPAAPAAIPRLPGMEEPEPAPEEPAAAEVEEEVALEHTGTPHLLFRYFDFTAEAGKTYRYRVVLALDNPNYGIDENQLDPRDAGKHQTVYAVPSAPTETVTMPFDGSLFAGELMPPTAIYEIRAKVAVEQWLSEGGMVQYVDPVFRGRLANFRLDPAVKVPPGGAPSLTEKGTAYKVRTEMAVLDMMADDNGGKAADLLLMDASGRLAVRKGQSDLERFERIEQNVKTATEAGKKTDPRKPSGLEPANRRPTRGAATSTRPNP